MVQMVENAALLRCRLVALRASGQASELEAELIEAQPVEGLPNLFADSAGLTLSILVKGPVPAIKPGDSFSVLAHMTGKLAARADPGSLQLL